MNQIWVGHTSESCIETVINILEAADSVETSLADFRPYYIVTPTASLAEFYSAELARRNQDFGVTVMTLYGFAAKILHHNGLKPFRENPIFGIIVREAVDALSRFPEVAALSTIVSGFDDGLDALVRSIKDLFIASFVPEQLEPILELLREPKPLSLKSQFQSISDNLNSLSRERACAVVRIAAYVYQYMQAINGSDSDFGLRESVMWQASECLNLPSNTLPLNRGVAVVGLVDATGMVNSFLEVLSARLDVPVQLIFQHALDTLNPKKKDASNIVVDTYFERQFLSSLNVKTVPIPTVSHQTKIYCTAPSRQAELRAVFKAIKEHQSKNSELEFHRVAVVARSLEQYLPFIEREAHRLGLPVEISPTLKVPTSDSAQINGLMKFWADKWDFNLAHFLQIDSKYIDLLNQNDLTSADIIQLCRTYGIQKCSDLITLLDGSPFKVASSQLKELEKSGDITQGLLHLAQWTDDERFSWYRQNLSNSKAQSIVVKTPFVTHIEVTRQNGNQGVPRRRKRAIPIWVLVELMVHVNRSLRPIDSCKTRLSIAEYTDIVLKSLGQLRGESSDTITKIIEAELQGLNQSMEQEREIDWSGWMHILGRLTHGARMENIGQSYGIKVLTAPEAMGHHFEALFLIGLNQGVFPEQYAHDSLMNDGIRNILLELLPDISIRSAKGMVERHMFCTLFWSSPFLWLSWLKQDEMGSHLNPSTLVSRLLLDGTPVLDLPDIYEIPPPQDWSNYTAEDWMVLYGLYGKIEDNPRHYTVLQSLAELHWTEEAFASGEIYARHRLRSMSELNKPVYEESGILDGLGPMGGLTGSLPYLDTNELETGLYVTSIEGHIRCPWKHFLSRQLGLCDIDDENIGLPNFQSNTLGNVVHEFLEFWVNEYQPSRTHNNDIGHCLNGPSFNAYWHKHGEGDQTKLSHHNLLERAVSKNLNEAGQLYIGTLEAAKQEAGLFLEVFRLTLDDGVLPNVLGAELDGACRLDVNHQTYDSQLSFQNPHVSGSSSTIQIKFKADRVDFDPETAQLSIIDYKTGKYWGTAKVNDEEDDAFYAQNRVRLVDQILQGRMLQPIAYLGCREIYRTDVPELSVSGELLYLNTEAYPLSGRRFQLTDSVQESQDEKALLKVAINGLGAAALATLMSRKEGLNFPRAIKLPPKSVLESCSESLFKGPNFVEPQNIEDYKLSRWCKDCEVRTACRYGDSSFHGRLKRTMFLKPKQPIEHHLHTVWSIGQREKKST